MAWPTNKPDSNAFTSDTNSIKESRPELETMSQAVNNIVDFVDTSGIQNGDVLVYDSTSGTIKPGTNYQLLQITAGTNITIDQDSAGAVTINSTGGGLNAVVEDTSPVLGGDLEVGDFVIKSTDIDSGGESAVSIRLNTLVPYRGLFAETDTHAGPPYPTNNTLAISNNGGVQVYDRTNQVYMQVSNLGFSFFDSAGHGLTALRNNPFKIISHNNQDIQLRTGGTGKVEISQQYKLPNADGSAGQVLQTDGAGNLSFANVSSGSVSPLTANLETGGYNIVGSNGELNLFVDGNDSGGAGGIQLGTSSGYVYVNQGGNHIGSSSAQISLAPGPTVGNVQMFMKTGPSDDKIYIRAPDSIEINRIQIRDSISQTASVGQVLRVASINNAGVFNTNDVVDLEFATISGGAGSDIQIEASPTGNITVTQPDSGGAYTISLADPLNNPIDANNQAISNPVFRGYNEHINTGLSTSGTITPVVADGNVAVITLSGNITINGFSGVATGDSMTIIIKQPASGGPYTLSSTMKFAGGNKTLSNTPNAIDVLSIFYDGTDYIASLSTNFN